MAKTIESVSFVESVRLCRIRGTRYVISRCTGHGSMDTRHCVARRWGEERGKPSFRRSLVDGRVRMPVGHRRCTRRKVTIGSGCRKLAGFASNGPCWYRVGYRAGRGGISGRSVAAQYDPTLRLYLTPPYVPLSASSASLSICTALVIRDRSNFERSCFVESCQRRSFRFSHR